MALAASACAAPGRDRWTGDDKLKHLVVAGALSAAAAHAARSEGASVGRARGMAVGLVLIVGAGKEWYDLRHGGTGWSWPDMAWNAAGALLGSALALGSP